MSGRACHAVELSPAYIDVAVKRWQAFTGQQATLEHTGDPWTAVAAQRATLTGETALMMDVAGISA